MFWYCRTIFSLASYFRKFRDFKENHENKMHTNTIIRKDNKGIDANKWKKYARKVRNWQFARKWCVQKYRVLQYFNFLNDINISKCRFFFYFFVMIILWFMNPFHWCFSFLIFLWTVRSFFGWAWNRYIVSDIL